MSPQYIAGLVVCILGVTGMIVMMLWFLRRVPGNCQACGAPTILFSALPADVQECIRLYYRRREERDPDVSAFFICPTCNLIADDFSGEKNNRSQDGVYGVNRDTLFVIVDCKNCHGMMRAAAERETGSACRRCGMAYQWFPIEGTPYATLSPTRACRIEQAPGNVLTR